MTLGKATLLLRQTLKELTAPALFTGAGRHGNVLPTFQGKTCPGCSQQTTTSVPAFSFEKLMAGSHCKGQC